jgi:hypothetical protein
MKSKLIGENTSAVEVTNISRHGIWILCNEQEYFLSYYEFPWFREATIGMVQNVKLLHSHHLYWPDCDVDIDLDSLDNKDKYPLVYR